MPRIDSRPVPFEFSADGFRRSRYGDRGLGEAMDEVRLLANCVAGLGFSYRAFQSALDLDPHMIGCDAGTSDMGPYYLGSGHGGKATISVKRDLEIMLLGARKKNIPLIIGSCGGAGAEPHLQAFRVVVEQIAREHSLHFRLALIHADQDKGMLKDRLAAGKVYPLGPVPPLKPEAIDRSTAIVGMMGAEPFIEALEQGANVILAGRASDPAIVAGVPLRAGFPAGLSWHAAKSVDKGYLATDKPREGSPVMARIRKDHFVVEPMKPDVRCTVATVSGVTMHENPNPFYIAQPSGTIDTSQARYEQLDDYRVKVSGSAFKPAERYTIKLEGAELIGYRSIFIAGLRDPRLIRDIDGFLSAYRDLLTRVLHSIGISQDDYQIRFRVFGRDAVMGKMEPELQDYPHEVGLIFDVVAKTQELASAIASRATATGSRFDYTGRLGGGGNFAYPFSPSVVKMGPVYQWSLWHLLEPAAGHRLFPVEIIPV